MKQLLLKTHPEIAAGTKLSKQVVVFQQLLDEIGKHNIPESTYQTISARVDSLNALEVDGLKKQLARSQSSIVRLLEKELKLVPKSYYQDLWMVFGMSAFGLPIGAAIGVATGNMAFLAIGLPIGMPIGMAIGIGMDKKAAREGRQLDVRLNA